MNNIFKVAFATNDGATIFAHFGRAKFFEVIEVKDGNVVSRERREKTVFHSAHHHDHNSPADHGERHKIIYSFVEDCDYIVAAGMGYGIYDFLSSKGKQPILTTEKNIDQALRSLISGQLINHTEKLH